MKTRLKYCDLLRFIAISSVVLIHVLADFRDFYLVNDKPKYFLLTCIDSFTRVGVPLFFMFTGIFMLSDKKIYTYKEFIKKRVLNLLLPFIIISFIYYIYEISKAKAEFSIINFISLFTTNGIKYHLWYMYSIISIYLLIPFFKIFIQKTSKYELKNLIILNFFMGNVLFTLSNVFSIIDLNMFSSFYFPSFIISINYLFVGYYLFKYKLSKRISKLIYKSAFISIILMPILDYLMTKNIREDYFLTATSMFAFIISIALFIFVKDNYKKFKINKKLEQIFKKCSSITFYIYLLHVLVMEIIKKGMLKVFVPNRFIENLFFIIIEYIFTFILSYIIALIFKVIYEKVSQNLTNILFNKKIKSSKKA